MPKNKLNRRKFLRNSSMGLLGTGLLTKNSLASIRDQQDEFPRIKEYRTLGRTGFKVSDIGTGYPYSEGVLRAALDSWVNMIETSEMYDRGKNESLIGSVIKDMDREKLFIATKISHVVKEYESVSEIVSRVNASLERLQTDYIDCLLIHGAENSARVSNKYYHKAVRQLQKAGKVRFTGISCHGHSWWDTPEETFEQVLMTAIDDGRFDVIMLPYNFIDQEMGRRVLKACRENNIGSMIMKSNPVQIYDLFTEIKEKTEKEGREMSERYKVGYEKYKKMAEGASEFFKGFGITGIDQIRDGAIQFVLSNEDVSTICCELPNFDDPRKYLPSVGNQLNLLQKRDVVTIQSNFGSLHCRICVISEEVCPHHLPVNTILRYNYYFNAKKQEKRLWHYTGNCLATKLIFAFSDVDTVKTAARTEY
ncbi:MAG: aldo/keto reductase [Bacteroidales bacterium]